MNTKCPYCNNPLPPGVSKCQLCGGLAEMPIAKSASDGKNMNLPSVVLGVCGLVCLLAGLCIQIFGLGGDRFTLFFVIAPPVGITGLIFGIKHNCKLGIVLNVIGWGILWIFCAVAAVISVARLR